MRIERKNWNGPQKHPHHIAAPMWYIIVAEALHALQSIGSTLESRLSFRQGYALIGPELRAKRKLPATL